MAVNEHAAGAGPKVGVVLDELRAGASQLHDLAGETTGKLASSDQALAASSQAWKGLKSASASAYAAYAEFETARGKSAVEALTAAAGNVGYAAGHYHGTDESNADSLA